MSPRDVRILGGFFATGGAVLFYFGHGWKMDGFIPLDWFGAAVAVLGIAMAVFPKRFGKA